MNFHVSRQKGELVILNRVERGEGSLVDLREIRRSLKLAQDDLIHQDTIHIIYVHLFRCPAQRNVGLRMTKTEY